MAYFTQPQPQHERQEIVPGMLQGETTFTGILERYLQTKELISKHSKQLESLETSHKQYDEQMNKMAKEMETLKLQEDELRKQLDQSLRQLETQVQANANSIRSIQSKLFAEPNSMSERAEPTNEKEKSILIRLAAIEKQVETNTQTHVSGKTEKRIAHLEIQSNEQSKLLTQQEVLIKSLHTEIASLHAEMNELSKVNSTEAQAIAEQPGFIKRLKNLSKSSPLKSLPAASFREQEVSEEGFTHLQKPYRSDSGYRSDSLSGRDSFPARPSSSGNISSPLALSQSYQAEHFNLPEPKDCSTPKH